MIRRQTSTRRVRLAAAGCACVLAGLALASAGTATAGARELPKGAAKLPNIVVVVTDDQARSTMSPEVMPNLYSKLIANGTTFTDYVIPTPLCCPSRAAYLTGQYGHNNGVLRNFYPDLRRQRNVLPTWLRERGYKTAHVGKFLNKYELEDSPETVAPGWDLWLTQLEKRKYYDWKASKNGRIVRFGSDDDDNVTAVTSRYATTWAAKLARRERPFYLQVDYYAPHTAPGRDFDPTCRSAPKPESEDVGRFATAPLPGPPSFNQDDVSQMPSFIRDRPKLSAEEIEEITSHYRCTLESLHGVDRGIGEIHDAIADAGELNRTVFVFTSDNGYFYGEHRVAKGKPYPYEENVHMPLTVSVPPRLRAGAAPVPASDAPVANIDLAPTLLELADAVPCTGREMRNCRTLDGRSLMPLIDGRGRFPDPRGIALERSSCDFRGVRWDQNVYVAWSQAGTAGCVPGEAEMYDLRTDPFQLNDLLPTVEGSPSDELRIKLARKMRRLGACSGIRGRDPRPPPGFHFCE